MLKKYLHRLYSTIISRGYVEIERLDFDKLPSLQGIIEGRLKFHDGSLLEFEPTQVPDLSEVLHEIEQLIFSAE
ncbi:MAG: hypothetical protein GY805_35725 [Chloroflexi bacterium]|nr:hypothetical protein [Chloroflexota bacterium]